MEAFFEPGALRDGEMDLVLAAFVPAAAGASRVPFYQFEMRVGRARAGHIALRIADDEWTVRYYGQIGYRVEPAFRGRRFAARACQLLRPLALRHGMERLWITCDPENLPSNRTCQILGARLVEIVDVPPDLELYRRGERRKCRYRWDLRAPAGGA